MSHDENRHRLRRILSQRLDDLRRAGVTHLPRPEASSSLVGFSSDASDGPAQSRAEAPVADEHSATAANEQQTAAAAARESSTSLFPELAPEPETGTETAGQEITGPGADAVPGETLSLEERRERLADLEQQVAACTRCQELAGARTQTVFGVGNPEARIMYVGEAPGSDEDRQGEPFVGRAGQLLNKIIAACRLKREDVYICNILKCRPPGNRNPTPEEAENCREYLNGQIATVDPEYIVCWGGVAAKNLLETTAPVGRLRGRFYTYGRAKVMCTYHPSYLLRNPSAKRDVWEDMKFLMRDMGVDLDAK